MLNDICVHVWDSGTLPSLICPSVHLTSQISASFAEEPEMTKSLVSYLFLLYLFVGLFSSGF